MSGGSALGLNKPAASPTRRGGHKRTVSMQSGTRLRVRAPQHGRRPPPTASAGDVLGQYTDRSGAHARSSPAQVRAAASSASIVTRRHSATGAWSLTSLPTSRPRMSV